MDTEKQDLIHRHDFHSENPLAERNTCRVIWLTLVMMVIEIVCGWWFGSMALLADGWHMGTHVFALGITVFAYRYARQHANDERYSFGTGKVSVLGGYSSAIVLGCVALMMVVESVRRLLAPERIHFSEALLVAVIGLVVNLLSAWMLHGSGGHSHAHDGHHHGHHDHNLRAAYLHVVADALTSPLLAILALLAGQHLGLVWMDPLMGIVGALVITRWALGLLRDAAGVLLDRNPDPGLSARVRAELEQEEGTRVTDLHLWQVSSGHLAVIVALVSSQPQDPSYYRRQVEKVRSFDHVSIEVTST